MSLSTGAFYKSIKDVETAKLFKLSGSHTLEYIQANPIMKLNLHCLVHLIAITVVTATPSNVRRILLKDTISVKLLEVRDSPCPGGWYLCDNISGCCPDGTTCSPDGSGGGSCPLKNHKLYRGDVAWSRNAYNR